MNQNTHTQSKNKNQNYRQSEIICGGEDYLQRDHVIGGGIDHLDQRHIELCGQPSEKDAGQNREEGEEALLVDQHFCDFVHSHTHCAENSELKLPLFDGQRPVNQKSCRA